MASFLDRLQETFTSSPSTISKDFQQGLDKLGVGSHPHGELGFVQNLLNPFSGGAGPLKDKNVLGGGKGGGSDPAPKAPDDFLPQLSALYKGLGIEVPDAILQAASDTKNPHNAMAVQYMNLAQQAANKPHMPSAQDIGGLTQMVMQAERPFLQDMTQGVQGLAQQLKGVQHLTPQYASAFGNAADMMGNAAKLSAGSQAASTPIAAWALSQLPGNAAQTQQATSGLSALLGGAGIPPSLGGKQP